MTQKRKLLTEKEILDDILKSSLNEAVDFNSLLQKVKKYSKQGLLTASILSSLMASPKLSHAEKGKIKSIATVSNSKTKDSSAIKNNNDSSNVSNNNRNNNNIKTTVIKDKDNQGYAYFGDYSNTIKEEGWVPVESNNDFTSFRCRYDLFNSIMIDGKSTGQMLIIAHKNKQFDLVINDKNNNHPNQFIYKGVDINTIMNYTRKFIGNRVDDIKDSYAKGKEPSIIKSESLKKNKTKIKESTEEIAIKLLIEKIEKITNKKVVLNESIQDLDKGYHDVRITLRALGLNDKIKIQRTLNHIIINFIKDHSPKESNLLASSIIEKGYKQLKDKTLKDKVYYNLKNDKNVIILIEE